MTIRMLTYRVREDNKHDNQENKNYDNIYYCVYMCFFCFSSGRSFLVLSAPGHAGSRSPTEHDGASVGPGRGPWHVLWGF